MRRIALLASFAVMAVTVSTVQAAVKIESFSAGVASTVAGAHADASTAFHFESVFDSFGVARPFGGEPAQIVLKLPPGVVGDAQNVARCPRALFADSAVSNRAGDSGGCPASTMVGEATVLVSLGGIPFEPLTLGVYNVQPGPGAPAELGIQGLVTIAPVTVPIQISASAADYYALTATVPQVPREPFDVSTVASSLTLWAVPAEHTRRDGNSFARETGANQVEVTPPARPAERTPFMQNPTGCSTTPLTTLRVNTYEEPSVFTEAIATSPIPSDCAHVPFAPSLSLQPTPAPDGTTRAGAPTGVSVNLHLPQSNDPNGRGTAELQRAVVTLPQGMTISPTAASKTLEGCTDEQFGAGSDAPAQCPPASVIGQDEVQSPLLLSGPLTGSVYLGQPLSTDPTSGRMFRVFQELQGFGLDIKLQGSVTADPTTGQLTASFANLPELPFEDFRMRLTGGANAVLVNPPICGSHTTTTQLYSYSSPTSPVTPSSAFQTTYDGNGASCPPALPFSPSAAISTAGSQAGASSPLSVTIARPDGTQAFGQLDAKLPPGVLAYVSRVPLCEALAAGAGACPADSRIGTVSTSAGAGPDPLTVQGSVYLARGSNGYPFMLSVVVPAVAGPYDLGNVLVPVWLQVNSDGSITAVSGPLPSILDGIPLDIRAVTLAIHRPGFVVNPTSCAPLSLSGTASSLSGTFAQLSASFQATGCTSLPFAPSFTVATSASTSRARGASLTVRVAQRPGEAALRSVHVQLPKQLPSRLTTLRRACLAKTFEANPATCPPGSNVGTATAVTPLLSSALRGPAILVSRGNAAFPDLEIILQGEGVTVLLNGQTDIKKSITSSTFASLPDVPISGFQLTLPEGPFALLSANRTLCTSRLLMPTTIVAQSGVVLKRATRIAVTGCPAAKRAQPSRRSQHHKRA